MIRMPGGSWSDAYDWLGCELGDPERCDWHWAIRPSEYLALLESTGLPGMWTVSINSTAEEAAALVAFFNGDVGDTRPIGTDRNGRNWLTVGHWAQLRTEHGHPEAASIHYWEIGNEIYGAVQSAGPHCASWGWEDAWTCDGTEYVDGTTDHDGFLQFRQAMRVCRPRHRGGGGRCRRSRRMGRLGQQGHDRSRGRHRFLRRPPIQLERRRVRG